MLVTFYTLVVYAAADEGSTTRAQILKRVGEKGTFEKPAVEDRRGLVIEEEAEQLEVGMGYLKWRLSLKEGDAAAFQLDSSIVRYDDAIATHNLGNILVDEYYLVSETRSTKGFPTASEGTNELCRRCYRTGRTVSSYAGRSRLRNEPGAENLGSPWAKGGVFIVLRANICPWTHFLQD